MLLQSVNFFKVTSMRHPATSLSGLGAGVLALLLGGCATSTGVTPIGEDTYLITRSGAGFWTATATVKAEAYKDATQYCVSLGKKFQVVHVSEHAMSGRPGDFPGAEIQFMCLDARDPELNRPKLKREADALIEVRKDIRTRDDTVKSKDVYAELIKLDDLRKRGILSDAEFDAQKKHLLNGN
jgi:hypothetical protein